LSFAFIIESDQKTSPPVEPLSRLVIPLAALADHPISSCDTPEITSFIIKSDQLKT
jgi:hypothetical protein